VFAYNWLVWFVYVLVSRAGRTYVGVTTDVDRRLGQHNGLSRGGARATRAGRPWRVGRILGPLPSRGRALSLEYAVKQVKGRRRLSVEVVIPARRKPRIVA
jgi:predicted GIY-YIG superfamily endonuclease